MAIQARDREIARLNGRLSDSHAQQASIHGGTTAYYRKLQKATMAMCNDGGYALCDARGLIGDQSRVIVGLRNRLWYHRVPWSRKSSIPPAAIAVIGAPGLNPRELYLNSRLFYLFAQQFPDVISLVLPFRSAIFRRHLARIGGNYPSVIASDRIGRFIVEWCFAQRSSFCNDGTVPIERPTAISSSSPST